MATGAGRKRGMPRTFGHKAGVEALREIIKYSDELGVEALTVYAFRPRTGSARRRKSAR